jgi:hypothetical protein
MKMPDLNVIIEKQVVPPPLVRRLGRSATLVAGPKEFVQAYSRTGRDGVFCVEHVLPFLELLVKTYPGVVRAMSRLLVLDALDMKHWPTLLRFFRGVVAQAPTQLIKDRSELLQVLMADNRDDLLLGGSVDEEAHAVNLVRGNLESLVVPFDWFSTPATPTNPDFTDFEVIDCGQTLRLGAYEAATSAILYCFDAEYRKRAKRKALEQDTSFGGALKRLRLQKGLTREDFRDISAKEIARIESGKVRQPHEATRKKLAKVLKVDPDEIEAY